jgi:hypothetical protein
MNCDDVRTRLDHPDYAADGALTPDALAHIEGCADCARYRERLAAILDPSSVLPGEIPPPSDLWPGIASRLETTEKRTIWREKRKIWRLPNLLPLAAAAGLAAILVASLFSLPPRQSETVAALPIQTPETDPVLAPARLPAETVEIGFVQTRAVLMKRFEAQKRGAVPERVAALERTLSTVESAVQDIHAALERDPYNSSLLFKLSDTRRRELRLLQQVVL